MEAAMYLDAFLPRSLSRAAMDELYRRYNRREFVHPDPLEFLYGYSDPLDQEVVGLIAACLAYGRVNQILKSVSQILSPLGPSPSAFLLRTPSPSLKHMFSNFKHRFTTGDEVGLLLVNVRRILKNFGSLQGCFVRGLTEKDVTVLPGLIALVRELNDGTATRGNTLLASPLKGSACKRLNLFLRWMVRSDEVDLGVWREVSPSLLIVPLDTHMHRIGLKMGLTVRKQADIRTAMEITTAFMSLSPDDPVRYDFALTRLGIRRGIGMG